MGKRYANDNNRPPWGWLVIACVALWFLIIRGVGAVLQAVFG